MARAFSIWMSESENMKSVKFEFDMLVCVTAPPGGAIRLGWPLVFTTPWV